MVQIIVAIIVAIWFFCAAREVGRSGIGWMFAGLAAFLLPSLPWALIVRFAIMPALLDSDMSHGTAVMTGLLIGLVGIGLGLGCAFFVRSRFLATSPVHTGKRLSAAQNVAHAAQRQCPHCKANLEEMEVTGSCPCCGGKLGAR